MATLEGLLSAKLLETSMAEGDVAKAHELVSPGSSPLHMAGGKVNQPVSAPIRPRGWFCMGFPIGNYEPMDWTG